MREYMFYILFFICFHYYSFKDSNYFNNWDDDFLFFFDFSLNPLIPKQLSAAAKSEIAIMISKCILNPKTFTSIDNLCQAIQHYKGNKDGKTIPATKNLIAHMKEFSNFWIGLKYNFYKLLLA